jgi:hypothetical protein
MLKVKIDERKHKLDDIIIRQGSSPTTVRLFTDFLNAVDIELEKDSKNHSFRTHQKGVTGMCRPRKAFIYVDLYQDHVSMRCFTNRGNIPGLKKGFWHLRNDNKGSELFQITDEATIKKAVSFAIAAWDLAS